MAEEAWFFDQGKVAEFGKWLVVNRDFDAGNLQDYYEAPYDWDAEWREYQDSLVAKVS